MENKVYEKDRNETTVMHSTSYYIWKRIISDPPAVMGAIVILIFVLVGIFAPFIAPYPPNEADSTLRLAGIGTEGHLLGMDSQGRDMLSRLIYGTRYSLITGLVPVLIGALISLPLGLLAAYFRLGFIMRIMDVFFAFPMVLLAIMLAAILGPGTLNLLTALVIILIPYNTRVVYTEATSQRAQLYLEAAKACGTNNWKILFVELLPNVASPSIVYSTTIVGATIINAAGLSFLGLGVQPPRAEWGLMISGGRSVLAIAPHISILPGLAMALLVISFNLMGDSLRDALDPRIRSTRLSKT